MNVNKIIEDVNVKCEDTKQSNLQELNEIIPTENATLDNAICPQCKKEFSCKAQLTRHLKTHAGFKKHVCEKCGITYREAGSLRRHILAKHTNREKPYKCNQCSLSFDLRSTLTRHVRTHTGEKPFGCDICHKSYPSKSYLNKHRKVCSINVIFLKTKLLQFYRLIHHLQQNHLPVKFAVNLLH